MSSRAFVSFPLHMTRAVKAEQMTVFSLLYKLTFRELLDKKNKTLIFKKKNRNQLLIKYIFISFLNKRMADDSIVLVFIGLL